MKWFDTYHSNTLAGSGNQYYFVTNDDKVHRGRIYYKIFAGGTFHYSLLYSNLIDSTYSDGKVSHCNLVCKEWELVEVLVGVCEACDEKIAAEPKEFHTLRFNGNNSKHVRPGEFFTSDPVEISAHKGDFLCVEIAFRGAFIPYHEESILPVFRWEGENWVPSKKVPIPGMIGCDRKVRKRVAFIGDSITQGIGTPVNGYTHWNVLVAEAIGEQYSYWNLGLGFGRAQDAASDGAWLYKAKQNDVVVVCYGINDIAQDREIEEIKKDLLAIVKKLKEAGTEVVVQTLPPFDFKGAKLDKWRKINTYIHEVLSNYADELFDVVPILINGEEVEGFARYGGHPNETGCAEWAKALIPIVKAFLED